MKDLVIVSLHPKGFPQADFYEGHGETPADEFNSMGCAPDGFFTLSSSQTLDDAKAEARRQWPAALIVEAEEEDGDEDEEQ
jgi:hypothetical protein